MHTSNMLALMTLTAAVLATVPALAAPADAEILAQAEADKAAYERSIAELESGQGAWGAELSEAWFGLGSALRILEQHEEAATAFNNALQSLRISAGLHDLQQLPILEQLVATYTALEDWLQVDALHYLMHYITRKNPATPPALRYQAMQQLGRWLQRATTEGLLPEAGIDTLAMSTRYRNELSHFEDLADYPGRNLHLAGLNLELAAFEFAQAQFKHAQPISEFQSGSPQRSVSTTTCQQVRLADGRIAQICTTTETPDMSYYLLPSNRKISEIRGHLDKMKDSIIAAFGILEEETQAIAQRNALLEEVQRLTASYNAFVTQNTQ